MRGFSGDSAYRFGDVFIKETNGNPKRLLHQAHKQMKYCSRLDIPGFAVPRVTAKWKNGFAMEYINGKSLVDIMIKEPEMLPWIADKILELIDWEFNNSVNRPFRFKKLVNKLSPSCPRELQDYIIAQAKRMRWKWIPYGLNHGDLTGANMLFKGDTIYLIDFLQTFLRTPYQDIAKLLQEIDFHWAALMSDYASPAKELKFGYDYLNHRIQEHLRKKYSTHKQAIRVFHFMCLCRLFPYCEKNGEIYDMVRYRCLELIDNEDNF